MARLATLKPRVKTATTTTVKCKPVERVRGRRGQRDRERVLKRDNYLCVLCAVAGRVTEATEVDHITPLSEGGSDADENKQSLCGACHKEKTSKERASWW